MGQQYDIVVTADQASVATDFWMRAILDAYCSGNASADDIRGIVHYGDSTDTPTTTGYAITESDCGGEPYASIVPYLSLTAESSGSVSNDDAVTVNTNTNGFFKWYICGTTFIVEWADPTALQILNGETIYNTSDAVIELSTADECMVLVIETTLAVPHPIHLHGHDFFVLAQGSGTYTSTSRTSILITRPPRRDVAILPGSGYLVISFQAYNPGAWLAHCHIGWYTEEGFALQFVERNDEIAALYDSSELEAGCDAWTTYQTSADLVQDDSGV